jgi:predicted transcriptional regulator
VHRGWTVRGANTASGEGGLVARKRSVALTDAELRVMRVLWDKGRGTVGEVVDAIPGTRKPAYNTVLTIMRILETKGYVAHEKAARAHVYHPLINRRQARRSAVSYLLNRFFDNSPELLVLNLLQDDAIDRTELQRVRALIDEPARERRREPR